MFVHRAVYKKPDNMTQYILSMVRCDILCCVACSISMEEHVQQPIGGGLGGLRPDLSWVPQID